ncbi:two-component system response regulator [Geothermobacter hydrogeniphilus]|uniref:Two-component system response regulator n=1 Tax=Geothermobacter hydrogeniphilus TaxID=1969733 RepID=A0A2K2HEX2_9BACT|nr:response regulator [Geothermobacter hydrogeniphilus]PNU21819.1 two-component system response regulator [Geothermobacter hydrogeniphilus]
MKRKKVLLVDDVRLFLEMAKSFLSRENLQLTVSANGCEALKVMRAVRPDLVIMDLHMPEMDGAAACREIKTDPLLGNVPVVLLAGRGRADEEQRCRAAGCDALLHKPFRRNDLLAVARRFLAITDRVTPRVETRMLVRYGPGKTRRLHDYTLNLSVGGLFLETEQVLPVASPLSLEFLVPGAAEPVVCQGQVAWVNAAGSRIKRNLPAGLGVQFSDLSSGDQNQLREFIRRECGA